MALKEVDYDPFKGKLKEVDYDPFKEDKSLAKTFEPATASAMRALIGLAKPPAAIAEMVGWDKPAKDLLKMDEEFKKKSGLGGSISSIVGDLAGFMLPAKELDIAYQGAKTLPKFAKLAGAMESNFANLPNWAKAATTGAGASLLTPTGKSITEPGYFPEKAEQAGTGAILGPAAEKVVSGVSRVLSPQLQRLKDLAAQGIDVKRFLSGSKGVPGFEDTSGATLGQTLGGSAQALERILRVLPGAGIKGQAESSNRNLLEMLRLRKQALSNQKDREDAALKATYDSRQHPLQQLTDQLKADSKNRYDKNVAKLHENLNNEQDQYHLDVLNKVLSNLKDENGQSLTLPKDVVGSNAIKHIQDRLSETYNKATGLLGDPELGGSIKITPELETKLKKVVADNPDVPGLDEEVNKIIALGGDSKLISPVQWQAQFQKLGDRAYNLLTKGNADDVELAGALKDIKGHWLDHVGDTEGGQLMKDANKAYSQLQGPQRAVALKSSMLDEGRFTPEQLVGGLKPEMSIKRYAAANDEQLQDALAAAKLLDAKRQKIEDQANQWKSQLEEHHGKLDAKEKEALDKIKLDQKEELDNTYENQNSNVETLVNKIKSESVPSSLLNKAGYELALGPTLSSVGLGGLSFLGAHQMDLPLNYQIAAPIAAVAAPALATRFGYTGATDLLKDLATERPEFVKQAGKMLQENLPTATGALVNTAEPTDYKLIGGGKNVQIYSPEGYENAQPIPTPPPQPDDQGNLPVVVPKRAGGLVHLR